MRRIRSHECPVSEVRQPSRPLRNELRKQRGTSKIIFLVPLFDLKFLPRTRRNRSRNFKLAAPGAAVRIISGSNIPEQVENVRLDSPLAWPGRGFDRDRPSGLMTGQDQVPRSKPQPIRAGRDRSSRRAPPVPGQAPPPPRGPLAGSSVPPKAAGVLAGRTGQR